MKGVKYASVHPSNHSAATPQCFPLVHPQQCCEVGTHLGKVQRGRRCAVQNGEERCRPGRRAKGSRSGGEGLDLPVHPRHQWPPWMERRGLTSVGQDQGGCRFPRQQNPGRCEELAREGLPRLNYTGFASPTKGTAASGETRAS